MDADKNGCQHDFYFAVIVHVLSFTSEKASCLLLNNPGLGAGEQMEGLEEEVSRGKGKHRSRVSMEDNKENLKQLSLDSGVTTVSEASTIRLDPSRQRELPAVEIRNICCCFYWREVRKENDE